MNDVTEMHSKEEGLTTAAIAGAGNPTTQRPGETVDIVEPGVEQGTALKADGAVTPLFPAQEADDLRKQWDSVQAGFVDEPRRSVEQADSLVAGAMKRLAETFAQERANLEAQWDSGDNVSTEDLRVSLQRYRSFFGRLLSM